MLTIHHLNDSRSQRILWLMEELGLDYDLVKYQRDQATRLAPPELAEVHPLGKAPVVDDGDLRIHESGAIVDYLITKYGDGKMMPKPGTADYVKYVQWMHYAEGSAMLPLLLRLYTSRLGDGAAPLLPRINSETMNHFSFVDAQMKDREYFVGDGLSGADIMMMFPLEAMKAGGGLTNFTNLSDFVDRMQARPAYLQAIKKGGKYSYGPS